jgi:hypothetical protein
VPAGGAERSGRAVALATGARRVSVAVGQTVGVGPVGRVGEAIVAGAGYPDAELPLRGASGSSRRAVRRGRAGAVGAGPAG